MTDNGNSSEFRLHGDVWLGDLWCAMYRTTIGTDAERGEWARECLDLGPIAEAEPTRSGGATNERLPGERVRSESDELRQVPDSDTTKKQRKRQNVTYGVVGRSTETDPGSGRPWLDNADTLPEVSDAQLIARPRMLPLYRPQKTRALLSTALATRREEGDIDIERVIDCVSRQRPLTFLPRLPVSTLRFGIQLLVDRGSGMAPFYEDQDILQRALLAVVGRDRVETLYFDDCPRRACGSGSRRTWSKQYKPPAAGTPAVLLSDLGIARKRQSGTGASVEEWQQFALLVCDANCPVIAIVPYGEARWPRQLRRLIAMVPWDRSTSVSTVRQLVGHGLEVAGKR
jgi:hypothetical protein